jgi:hypothetical protein
VIWRSKDDRLGGSAYTLACTRRESISWVSYLAHLLSTQHKVNWDSPASQSRAAVTK